MTTVLTYKDYQGSVTYDDGRLVIRILHIEDSVSDECDSANQAQAVFEDLVEDYLETCAAIGKEPAKPFKGSFNVRVAPALHKRAVFAATKAGETLNTWVGGAMEQRLHKEELAPFWDKSEFVAALFKQYQIKESSSRNAYATSERMITHLMGANRPIGDLLYFKASSPKSRQSYNG